MTRLGADTFDGGPISQFRLPSEDYPKIGARIAEIGVNAVNVLLGFEGG